MPQTNMPELVRKILAGEAPPPPIAQFVGFRVKSAGDGRSVIEFDADGRHANPMGTVHGGIFCDLADAAMGFALATTLEPGETFTTLELKVNYLKPVRAGRLEARRRVVRGGRTVALVECDVTDGEDDLAARAMSTCLIRRP